jgi:glucose-1-phosphate cytidylyltransferase
MQVVLLAGGLGSRLAEETTRIPKPMVEIGDRPIMLHVMDIYSHWGYKDFLIAAGYKSIVIKQFFRDYHLRTSDITVTLHNDEHSIKPNKPLDWRVSIVDTGARTMTGGRLLRLKDWLDGATFMVTYSDGVGNVDLNALLRFHRRHGRLATVTAVPPPARFGNLEIIDDQVVEFGEKVRKHDTWINGGFFVFEPGTLDYLSGDEESLEQAPLTNLARDGQLFAYKHNGFWHPMDTIRDRDYLNQLCATHPRPWMRFEPSAPTDTLEPRAAVNGP